jgi:hypothetical protein
VTQFGGSVEEVVVQMVGMLGDVIAQLGDVVAQMKKWWLRCEFIGSVGRWLSLDVLAQLGIWWLSWVVWARLAMAQLGIGVSVGNVVAQLVKFLVSVGFGCSVGDVVTQLGMWWLCCIRLGDAYPRKQGSLPGRKIGVGKYSTTLNGTAQFC